jgi:SAM-dependent methyltransferase
VSEQESVFADYSRYYDLLYGDKDYDAETAYVQALLARHGLKQASVLEFGCGTGRHGRRLAALGHRVHGIERSAEMVALVEPAEGFSFEQGDICTVHLGRRFDAVLALFHVVSYQVDNVAARAVFARAAEHLAPGGLFAFDVWYSPAVAVQRPAVRVKRVEDAQVAVTRIAEPAIHPNANRVDVHYTIFATDKASGRIVQFREVHPMRHFSAPEIELLADAAGFDVLGAEEFLSGAPPGENTWGVCFVLGRR